MSNRSVFRTRSPSQKAHIHSNLEYTQYEIFWAKALANIIPGVLPLSLNLKKISKILPSRVVFSKVDPSLNASIKSVRQKQKDIDNSVLLTSILLYFYRLNNYQNYTVKFSNTWLQKNEVRFKKLYASQLPISTDFNEKTSFNEAFQKVSSALHQLQENKTYARDIVLRYPELAENATLSLISIIITENVKEIQPSEIGALTIFMNREGTEFSIYSRKEAFPVSVNTLISNMSAHITTLMGHIACNFDTPVNKLLILTKCENQKILFDYNNTKVTFKNHFKPIHYFFEEQVLKTPYNLALVFENKSLTYFELNKKANQMAQHLQQLDVLPGSSIGICAKRSLEMVIGILGILKAGCAYLPLDPNYPNERLSYMLSDSKAPIVLTDAFYPNLKTNIVGTNIVEIDKILEKMNIESDINTASLMSSENLAYIIYTSGTTGEPKGVAITHRSLVNHMLWMLPKFNFTEKDVFLQKTPFSFDASVWEFFAPLLCGGKLVLASNEDPIDLNRLIKKYKVTILQLVPAMLRVFLEDKEFQACDSLQQVFAGGEALLPDIVSSFHQKMQAKLHNLYGPTETTIQVTTYTYDRLVKHAPEIILIGKPISNVQIYVLDKYLNPMPVGVPGELYIGGLCLAQGYLNREALTQSRFIQNPFNKPKKNKLYNTGDMVRLLPDGNLEYLDRLDNQVKFHGFRIELSEIEATLFQHEGIRECAVVAQERSDKNGNLTDKCLTAYYVKHIDIANKRLVNPKLLETQFSNELKIFLSTKLPSYMIPTRYVSLEKMPLNINGKLDRKALIKPDFTRSENYVAPRNVLEIQICQIWREVLGFPEETIGIHDDFFNLGGNSLSALRTLSLAKNFFLIKLPTRTIFDYPTIEKLSEFVHTLQKNPILNTQPNSMLSPIITLQKNGFEAPLFLIHPVGGTIFWYNLLSRYLGKHRPIYAIQDPGIDAEDLLFKSIPEMASFYLNAIQDIKPSGPYLLAGASFGGTVALEIANQLLQSGERVNFIGLLDSWPVYSNKFWEKEFFEQLMLQQFKRMDFTKDFQFLLKLQKHRMSMLRYYKIPLVDAKITFFKAEELWPVFKEMATSSNCWEPFSTKPVDTHMVPGNHETMFWEPHVQMLADKIHQSINKIDNQNLPGIIRKMSFENV